MLRSIELQSISTQVRQELTLVVTGLEDALFITDSPDPENLERHVFGAISILKTNLARIAELDKELGEYPTEHDAEGVA